MNWTRTHSKHDSARAAARLIAASRIDVLPDALERTLSPETIYPDFSNNEKTRAIGVWQATSSEQGAALVRSFTGEPWNLWADIPQIGAKGSRKRIVMLGESVARGFFYDPVFTPSSVLQAILDSTVRAERIEIIDLARTDLLLEHLVALMEKAMSLLCPDAFIVFAGNNWCVPGRLLGTQPEELAEVLRRQGSWGAVAQFAQSRAQETIQAALRRIERVTGVKGIPVLLVVPEFNLADWRNEYIGPPLFSNPEALDDWQATLLRMEDALARGNVDRATELSRELMSIGVEMDIRCSELIARTELASGDRETARLMFEQARDTSLSLPMIRSPRCFKVIQETIRAFATRPNFKLVDLPRCFTEYLNGGLPDRKLFHDYCHLTDEGIRLAAASIAEQLLSVLGGPALRWNELRDAPICIDDKVRGAAHILAGCHNGRWGQPYNIVRYHFAEALRLDPGSSEVLQLFLDWHIRQIPAPFCRSFHEMAAGRRAMLRYFSLAPSHITPRASVPLIKAILDVLGDPDKSKLVWEQFEREQGLDREPLDLLSPTYRCSRTGDAPGLDSFNGAFYRATTIESYFSFPLRRPQPLVLSIVCRMRPPVKQQSVNLAINAHPLTTFAVAAAWQRITVNLDLALLQCGLNSLTIRWPDNQQSADNRALQVVDQLEHGEWPEPFARYGEIQTLSLCTLHTSHVTLRVQSSECYQPSAT